MTLDELIAEVDRPVKVITDVTRLLPPSTTVTIRTPLTDRLTGLAITREILVEDEETGIIQRSYIKADGHLGAVEEY